MLIFCGTKKWCEETAKHIARHVTVPERSRPTAAAAGAADGEEAPPEDVPRAQLLSELTRVTAKPDDVLKEVLPAGVAYHHSGLTGEERLLVERAFCSGRHCMFALANVIAHVSQIGASIVPLFS